MMVFGECRRQATVGGFTHNHKRIDQNNHQAPGEVKTCRQPHRQPTISSSSFCNSTWIQLIAHVWYDPKTAAEMPPRIFGQRPFTTYLHNRHLSDTSLTMAISPVRSHATLLTPGTPVSARSAPTDPRWIVRRTNWLPEMRITCKKYVRHCDQKKRFYFYLNSCMQILIYLTTMYCFVKYSNYLKSKKIYK